MLSPIYTYHLYCYCFPLVSFNFTLTFEKAFAPESVLPPITARPDHVERALKARFHEAMTKLHPQRKELDLLIVILPDNNGSLYGLHMQHFVTAFSWLSKSFIYMALSY